MKTLIELMEEVRDYPYEHKRNRSPYEEGRDDGYELGHRAACDVLIPALKEAVDCLEDVHNQAVIHRGSGPFSIELKRIRAILEGRGNE